MALPATAEFRKVVEGLGLGTDPSPSSVVVQPAHNVLDEQGKTATLPEVRLTCTAAETSAFEAVRERVKRELGGRGHPSSDPVVSALLGLLAALVRPRERLETLNRWLGRCHPADLTQILVLPGRPAPGFDLRMGSFRMGEIELDRLTAWSVADSCTFFPQYAHELRGMFAIERSGHRAFFLDAGSFFTEAGLPRDELFWFGYQLVDNYFAAACDEIWPEFWDELESVQDVVVALDGPHIDTQTLRSIDRRRRISYLRGLGPRNLGWTVPMVESALEISYGRVDAVINEVAERSRDQFQMDPWKAASTPFEHSIHTFCEFLAIAHKHEANGRPKDAFLHHFIALELLLGSDQRISATLSGRVGVLVHRVRGGELTKETRDARALYDARSKYVHEGRSPTMDHLVGAKQLTRQVLAAALRARMAGGDALTQEAWTKKIDFVRSSIEADQPVEPAVWRAIGVED